MSTQNSNYEKVLKELTQSGITETPFSWFALAIGIIAKGVEPGSRIYNNVFSNLLNDNHPLPGAVVATLTNLGLDIKDKLDNASQDLFCFPDSSVDKKQRLQVLADLSYGLSLGLTVSKEDGSLEKVSSEEALADLNTISEVSKVDIEAELDEDDLNSVIEFMVDVAIKNYQLFSK